jgi:OmpA-OmpF porin, OOP family
MAVNLIEQMLGTLAGDTLNKIGAAVGVSPEITQAALKAGIPLLLGGMTQKATSPEGASDLLGMLTRGNHDSVLGSLGSALGGGDSTSSLLKVGASLLPMLFGNRADAITDLLGGAAGLNKSASSSLLSLLAPLAMGFVTKQLRGSGGLSLGSLAGLLSSQKGFLKAAAPAGMASALGLQSLDNLGDAVAPVANAARQSGWVKWVLGLAILGLLLYVLRDCSGAEQKNVEAPVRPGTPAIEAPVATPAVPADGLVDLALADGTTIRVAEDGVESRLVAFIQDAAQAVDKDTWFTMDRLEFETGSAALRRSSDAQLDNIAAILRAYPNAGLKFGGYTDNTGDAAANLQLSGERATTAMSAVVSRGIGADRVAAEGYGDQFPVADNATEEGRQSNRRIDVRVSAK